MIRRKNKQIETPIIYYRHDNGSNLILVGTIHVAEYDYFKTIQKIIDINSDYKVLYEMVKSELDDTTINNHMMKQIASVMKLQFQKEGLNYSNKWINTDISKEELESLLDDDDTTLRALNQDIDFTQYNKEQIWKFRWFVNKIFSVMSYFTNIQKLFINYKILIKYRNKIAVRAILENIKNSNIISIWGTEHLRGIDKLLLKNGFHKNRLEWLGAYKLRPYTFWGKNE